MADEQSTEDEKPQKRAMPDFVKDALKTGTARPQKPASPKRVIANPQLTESAPSLLPFSSDTSRLVPDAVLRSALFSVVKKGARPFYRDPKEVATLEGSKVFYVGEQLDQGDLDVWETVLHIHSHRGEILGGKVRMSGYELLKLMGITDTGKNRATLAKRLSRLIRCSVIIKSKKYFYEGSMLVGVLRDEKTLEYLISLNSDIAVLFEPTRFSQVDWSIRQKLKGQLAQWLHGFYSSHAKPLPMKIETLHRLCGSGAKELRFFKVELIKALETIVEVSSMAEQPFSYEIVNNLVYVYKTASKTQKKHLAEKIKRTAIRAIKSETNAV